MSLSVFYYDASVFLFPSLSQFQSIFVSFVAISSVLCRCIKAMSLVEIYPTRASEKSGNLKTDPCVNHAN